MKKTKYISLLFLSAIAVVSLWSCGSGKKAGTEGEEEVIPENIVEMREDQIALAKIDTASPERRPISSTMSVNGIVTAPPQNQATVCAPYGGYVKSTTLIPGMFVSKGQVLAVLENQEFVELQKDYLETKSKLEYSEAEYKRYSDLYKENVYSEKSMQQVTSEYKILRAEKNALEQKLMLVGISPSKLTENNISSAVYVTSPISGYVKAVNVNIGKFVTSSDVMFEIVNSDKLLLELTLYEKGVNRVEVGQKIKFLINDEEEEHEAEVYQTGKSVGADKTYKVYATVVSKCKNIIPGMYVNAMVEASSSDVLAVPSEAVVSFDDKDYIFVFDRNKVENGRNFTEYKLIEIQKGVSDDHYTEIILPPDVDVRTLKVVVKGAYNLLSAKKNAGEMSC